MHCVSGRRGRRVSRCRRNVSRDADLAPCDRLPAQRSRFRGMSPDMNRTSLCAVLLAAACGGGGKSTTTGGALGSTHDTSGIGTAQGDAAGMSPGKSDPSLAFRKGFSNPGGMWMPQQMTLPGHVETFKKLGVAIDAKTLADPLAAPLAAIVSLGGCTASFVSADGLVVTNHHCVQGALQHNSTPKDEPRRERLPREDPRRREAGRPAAARARRAGVHRRHEGDARRPRRRSRIRSRARTSPRSASRS